MQVHRGVEYKVPVSAEVEAAFIAADVDGSGFICVSNARAYSKIITPASVGTFIKCLRVLPKHTPRLRSLRIILLFDSHLFETGSCIVQMLL